MLRSLFKTLKTPEEPAAPPAAVPPPAEAPAMPAYTLTQSAAVVTAVQAAAARVEAVTHDTLAAALARARADHLAAPDDLEALLTLAGLLLTDDPVRASELYAHAVALHPASALLLYPLAQSLQRLQRNEEAIAAMRLVVAAEPEIPTYRYALSMLLFLGGHYREGFFHFRARNNAQEQQQKHPWLNAIPAWGGESLAGRRLLVWTDWGGLGDELLFARYIAEVQRRFQPAALYVSCSAQDRRLFANIEGVTEAFADGGVFAVDCHAALLDLPCIFGTELASIPAPVPYLRPDPADVARWAARLQGMHGLKVGLCWSSGFWSNDAQFVASRMNKSLSLELLAPLCGIEGVTLISLQKGGALPQLAASGLPIHDFDADLKDMADTAALAANLDLIITVDTSVSHLAGGLNRPTLVLLPYSSGSFWLMHTERSPWYPGVRLLRHAHPGDWAGVAARAAELLRGYAERGAVDLFA
ncbi:MAG TPA: glycosyltransferase family 9 protein [Burkholderiales bacterium]|jgi:hypothetical protein|nr:glycosyltransferase family 9 protein [Burkholderiales bacterium]